MKKKKLNLKKLDINAILRNSKRAAVYFGLVPAKYIEKEEIGTVGQGIKPVVKKFDW